MHEFSFVENLVNVLIESIKKDGIDFNEIEKIFLEIGEMEIHSKEAFDKAYEILSKGKEIEKIPVDLKLMKAYINCKKCNKKIYLNLKEEEHHLLNEALCPECGEICVIEGGRGVGKIEVILKK